MIREQDVYKELLSHILVEKHIDSNVEWRASIDKMGTVTYDISTPDQYYFNTGCTYSVSFVSNWLGDSRNYLIDRNPYESLRNASPQTRARWATCGYNVFGRYCCFIDEDGMWSCYWLLQSEVAGCETNITFWLGILGDLSSDFN